MPYIASDICIAPNAIANAESKTLELMLLKPVSRIQLLKFFMKAGKGEHILSPSVQYLSVKDFELMIDNETIMFDGEEVMTNFPSVRCNVSTKSIKMFTMME